MCYNPALVHFHTVSESDEIYATIERRRKDLGLSQAQVSELAFKRSDTSAIQNIRRGSSPSVEKIAAIAQALGLEFYFGPDRGAKSNAPQGFAEEAAKTIAPAIDGSREALREGFLPIPYNSNDNQNRGVAPIAFSRNWLGTQELRPENLSFLSVTDERMLPSLPKGALVLIDSNTKEYDGATYGFAEGGKIGFARITQPAPQTLLLVFDNPKHPPQLKTDEDFLATRLLGRIVWAGHLATDATQTSNDPHQ